MSADIEKHIFPHFYFSKPNILHMQEANGRDNKMFANFSMKMLESFK